MVYNTRGTCSSQIIFDVEDNKVKNIKFVGGCPGNAQGVAKLCDGMNIDKVISTLEGIQCRYGTSCPDQLAKALKLYKENNQ